jgi:hypothetical protein
MTTETGGQAFPMPMTMMTAEHIANEPEFGMTLRDYFAASFISSGVVFKNLSSGSTTDQVAEQAYALADAMLKARQA